MLSTDCGNYPHLAGKVQKIQIDRAGYIFCGDDRAKIVKRFWSLLRFFRVEKVQRFRG